MAWVLNAMQLAMPADLWREWDLQGWVTACGQGMCVSVEDVYVEASVPWGEDHMPATLKNMLMVGKSG